MRWMTWSFGQVTVFTNLAISASGAGTRDGRAAAARPTPDFLSAMEHASHLVLRRSDDAIRLVYQQVLRPLPAKEAVDRGEPVSEAPLVLPSAKHAQHSRQAPGRPIVGRGIQSVAGKVVHAAMAHREDLPVLLPLVRLGTGVACFACKRLSPVRTCSGVPVSVPTPDSSLSAFAMDSAPNLGDHGYVYSTITVIIKRELGRPKSPGTRPRQPIKKSGTSLSVQDSENPCRALDHGTRILDPLYVKS